MSSRPIALTVGDHAGVGPELALIAAANPPTRDPVVVYGSVSWVEHALRALQRVDALTPLLPERVVAVDSVDDATPYTHGTVVVRDVSEEAHRVAPSTPRREPSVDDSPYPWADAVPWFGALQYAALTTSIDDALRGDVTAVVTAPWHKARLADAGLRPTGHTEVLAERTGAKSSLMVLVGGSLRVGLVTAHLPLREVADTVDSERIVASGVAMDSGLRSDFWIDAPRIAVCGLNPHAGERGVLGHEDRDVVAPAIEELCRRGVDAAGPFPADTLFPLVLSGEIRADGILAMYHDQGLAPLKTAALGHAVNVTVGLPIVRTSVDHGTAYDRAGRGTARRTSLEAALRLAEEIASRRARS